MGTGATVKTIFRTFLRKKLAHAIGSVVRLHTCRHSTIEIGTKLAKPNYQFAKRQKELAKKKKQEEKQKRKAEKHEGDVATNKDPTPTDGTV